MDFSTLRDFLLVFLGFGLIIFVHELGHFLAARWAGIRVLAFALGFGPAIASYRKGLGWRRGSSEGEYVNALKAHAEGIDRAGSHLMSPTEYRVNWLPFGGYVKMLGQEDLNPNAVSAEKDSYQNCPPWKRMVVISAGVVMNIITAALLFMIVFKVGLKTEAPVIGFVVPGSPAAVAVGRPVSGARDGASTLEPGLQAGDRVLEINGKPARQFNDLIMATAMARRGASVSLMVERETSPGNTQRLAFDVMPKAGSISKLLEIGVEPGRTATLFDVAAADRAEFDKGVAKLGLEGLEPRMTLTRVGDQSLPRSPKAIDDAFKASKGEPVALEFRGEGGNKVVRSVQATPEFETTTIKPGGEQELTHEHLLGLAPVLSVQAPKENAIKAGLRDGDVFARLGNVEFPSVAAGIAEVRAHAGRTIPIVVLRPATASSAPAGGEAASSGALRLSIDQWQEVSLTANVGRDGTIGFGVDSTRDTANLVSLPLASLNSAAEQLITRPGTRVVWLGGHPVANFNELRDALEKCVLMSNTSQGITIPVMLREPTAGAAGGSVEWRERAANWTIDAASCQRLASLGWRSPLSPGVFEFEQTLLRASGPIDAIKMGFQETKRVMVMTYVTFARLFEGTVKVEHLKGPVGIAHLGTKVASRGWVWLLFFLALVSVNLAVINFLPLPIVDGGQFLFLLIEQVRGKPVSIGIQNAATLAGLVLIVGMFLLVTFNDLVNLLG